MNILSINALQNSQPAFGAVNNRGVKKIKGVKPDYTVNLMSRRDMFFNTENNSAKTLEAKIKYAQKRLESEQNYLKENVANYKEKRYVEMTILRIKQELSAFQEALAKVLARKV